MLAGCVHGDVLFVPPPHAVARVHAVYPRPRCRWLGKHPNIVSLKDLMVDVPADELYVVMELMDTDLHRFVSPAVGCASSCAFLCARQNGTRLCAAHARRRVQDHSVAAAAG